MIVSLNWLSALLGVDLTPAEVAERLAMLGEPVERVEPVHQDLTGIVVGVVERVARHPNADRLWLCAVNNGMEVLDVVCGAPTVETGGKYPYAAVGSTLPGGAQLKGRKIRGVKSNGMLCSEHELALGTDESGILLLDTDAPAGTPLLDVLAVGDYRLDVEVTPNRPDLLCHRGVARDLGAVLGKPVKLTTIPGAPPHTETPVRSATMGSVGGVEVSVEDVSGCPRYMAAVIRGIEVRPSPDWLQRRLASIGQRPINNVVDATNHILFELNQPLHAFDLAKLAGPKIVVRRALDNEPITTLDGERRRLNSAMTAICDARGPVAVGGVMGGQSSEVSEQTTDVVLECAYFDPKRIRATRRTLRISTEASYRFERGTDLQGMPDALRRAVGMVIAVAGGSEAGPPVDVYPSPTKAVTIFLRPERVTQVLGVELPRAEIEGYLTSLGFTVAPKDGRIAVHVPGWRPDVTGEEDLIEELARLRGYDTFPSEMGPLRPSSVPDDPGYRLEARMRRILTGRGLHEARGISLGPKSGDSAQAVLNPLSAEEAYLRTDLTAGLVRAVEHNWSVRERDIRLFEIGTVFHAAAAGERPQEDRMVAGLITGSRMPAHWSDSGVSVDFDGWDVKSLLEEVARAAGSNAVMTDSGGRWVLGGPSGEELGWAGPLEVEGPSWAAGVFGFEVRLTNRDAVTTRFATLPSTPPVTRDLALLLPDGVTAAQVGEVVVRCGGKLLESADIFDEYRGAEIGGRSVAWRLVFRAATRTLRDKEVDVAVTNILGALRKQLGVERRET